jgi:hypothetical protein
MDKFTPLENGLKKCNDQPQEIQQKAMKVVIPKYTPVRHCTIMSASKAKSSEMFVSSDGAL